MTWLSPEQYAEAYGVSAYTVRKWCRDGTIPAKKLGKLWRIREDPHGCSRTGQDAKGIA